MQCENDFCIYCDNGECNLSAISIDAVGMCTKFSYITFDQYTLTVQKNDEEKHEK